MWAMGTVFSPSRCHEALELAPSDQRTRRCLDIASRTAFSTRPPARCASQHEDRWLGWFRLALVVSRTQTVLRREVFRRVSLGARLVSHQPHRLNDGIYHGILAPLSCRVCFQKGVDRGVRGQDFQERAWPNSAAAGCTSLRYSRGIHSPGPGNGRRHPVASAIGLERFLQGARKRRRS